MAENANGVAQQELRPSAEAEGTFRRWIAHLNEEFGRSTVPERRAEVVRDELYQIYWGRPHGGKTISTLASELPIYVATENFDPTNVTLPVEYEEGLDWEQFRQRKPLIWFWRMFDRSTLGENVWLGIRVRCMLAHHIFKGIGKGVKIHNGVQFGRGYTITIEDGCTILPGAVLEDREELTVPAGTVVKAGETFGGKR